ncbi:MAG TPA: hypothetical protein VG225_15015 [Terracidiphilus sp.]|jgi:hypothetical protein|nr:hypothetical protein [Terracidiphilus sp.]
MQLFSRYFSVISSASLLVFLSVGTGAQEKPSASQPPAPAGISSSAAKAPAAAGLPDAPQPQAPPGQTEKNPNTTERKANKEVPRSKQQPKRILGLMPNYRAVSAGAIPPPPGPRRAFVIATQNSFDYSSFVFVGLTSMIAEGEDAHPKLGKGVPGLWAYSWRGMVDKTDGNYWVIFALPSVFHEDERYFAKGEGPKFKRGLYAASRVLITPDYQGHDTVNSAELLGRGIAQGISLSYYPSSDRTAGALAQKYAYALLRDSATNTFREFWPDIASHVGHHHSASTAYNVDTGAETKGN